jgi:hypothetical protein
MQIPSYQIHNVLKVYSKQLSQSRIIERQKALGKKADSDKINISAEAKRQAIINRVAADIVDRITNSGPQDEVEQEIVSKLENEIGKSVQFASQSTGFVFNEINGDNEKTTNTLQMNDSSFLIKRLEELAKEAVDKNIQN